MFLYSSVVTSLTIDCNASSFGFNSSGSLSKTSLTSFTASVILIPVPEKFYLSDHD